MQRPSGSSWNDRRQTAMRLIHPRESPLRRSGWRFPAPEACDWRLKPENRVLSTPAAQRCNTKRLAIHAKSYVSEKARIQTWIIVSQSRDPLSEMRWSLMRLARLVFHPGIGRDPIHFPSLASIVGE